MAAPAQAPCRPAPGRPAAPSKSMGRTRWVGGACSDSACMRAGFAGVSATAEVSESPCERAQVLPQAEAHAIEAMKAERAASAPSEHTALEERLGFGRPCLGVHRKGPDLPRRGCAE